MQVLAMQSMGKLAVLSEQLSLAYSPMIINILDSIRQPSIAHDNASDSTPDKPADGTTSTILDGIRQSSAIHANASDTAADRVVASAHLVQPKILMTAVQAAVAMVESYPHAHAELINSLAEALQHVLSEPCPVNQCQPCVPTAC